MILHLIIPSILTVTCLQHISAFQINPSPTFQRSSTSTSLKSSSDSIIEISQIPEDDESAIFQASQFMLYSFWIPLSSSEPLTAPLPPNVNTDLTSTILDEFTTRYGELMTSRKLSSALLSATLTSPSGAHPDRLVGIVGVDVSLVDTEAKRQYTRVEAETAVKMAVGGLPPSKRREWGKKSVPEIANELLDDSVVAVAVLSNLAVDPNTRRMGVGRKLCTAVEELVKGKWGGNTDDTDGLSKLYLRVEGGNVAARGLYESEEGGFSLAWVEESAVSLRADLEEGTFEEISCEIVSLLKDV